MDSPRPGELLLVPNALDFGLEPAPIEEVLPRGVLRRATALSHWVVEDARSARAFLKRVGAVEPLSLALQEISIRELPRARKGGGDAIAAQEWDQLLAPALAGSDVGLLSEAGLPAVADPGALLVAAAHRLGIAVRPLPGPSSLLLALAASGCNGQSFAFVGYLPQDAAARERRLRELETHSRRLQQAQLIIETPYRNAALLAAMLACLAPATRLSVSCGLTTDSGWTRSAAIEQWKLAPSKLPDRVPAVFVLQAV